MKTKQMIAPLVAVRRGFRALICAIAFGSLSLYSSALNAQESTSSGNQDGNTSNQAQSDNQASGQAQDSNKLTDANVRQAIEAGLIYDAPVDANNIDVQLVDGVATLTGTAPNLISKERATTIAEGVRGVRSVVNNIQLAKSDINDTELRDDVRNAILYDPATDSYEVTVEVSNGSVSLTGEVDSWQEKQLCAFVVKGVNGVRGIQNDITISYEDQRTDTEILTDVEGALKRDAWVDASLIEPTVDEGIVSLQGTVGSMAEKTRALSRSWVNGVTDVRGKDLNVEPWAKDGMKRDAPSNDLSDKEIKESVKDAFLYDPRVYSFNPQVAVENGVVTLTGTVDNLKAKRAASQDAMNTSGVWRVRNHLKVRSDNAPSGQDLVQKVEQALDRDAFIEDYEIAVTAVDQTVYLTGAVDSSYEKSHAEDVASRIEGVATVNNNLRVDYPYYTSYNWPYTSYYTDSSYYNLPPATSTWPYTSDAEVKDDIQDEIFWSPFVDSDDVNVTVNNGVATLRGEVDDWNEYYSATENAYEGGARSVINNLDVG